MLGKLFKYEFKSTARYMLPAYLFIIVMAFINMFFIGDLFSATSGGVLIKSFRTITFMLYYFSVVAIFILTILVAAGKFYKNLLGNEGYISLTLPVSIDKHITVKLVTAFTWMVLSAFVVLLSAYIVSAGAFDIRNYVNLPAAYRAARNQMNVRGINLDVYLLTTFLIGVFGVITSFLQMYFAMSIGQLSAKHKIGMSVLAYFVIYVVMQFIAITFLSSTVVMIEDEVLGAVESLRLLLKYEYFILIWQIVLSIGFYIGTRYFLKNKINLQ